MCVIIYNSLSSRASVAHPWAPEPQELQVLHPLAIILLLYTAWTTKAWRSHLKHNQPFYLIPGHRFWTCCHLVYHQVTILNSHKLFYEMFANRTARFYIGAIFTIQPVSITLTILFTKCVFHPFIHAVEAWNTRLQLIDTSSYGWSKYDVATPVSLY
jgi:hypothetical protein